MDEQLRQGLEARREAILGGGQPAAVGPPTEAELAEWERQFTYNPSATAGYGRGTTEPVQRLIAEVRRLRAENDQLAADLAEAVSRG